MTAQLDQVFGALANPTRRAILERLADGPATVHALAAPFTTQTLQSISKHIKVLEHAGLIRRERIAQTRPAVLAPEAWRDAHEWIERYQQSLEERYDRLETVLAETDQKQGEAT
jgi:DNA-binding transcriptional ArsR family regulator